MATERERPETIGFGFEPANTSYHFAVILPRDQNSDILVEERFAYGEDYEDAAARARLSGELSEGAVYAPRLKVIVTRHRWQCVDDDVKREFNRQLRVAGYRPGTWKPGENYLSSHLGKELTLLLWAIEEAEPGRIPAAVANWAGLAPEERWWLYTTVNAATGHAVDGRNRGWRKAIGIAFVENPVAPRPYFSRSAPRPKPKNGNHANGTNGKAPSQLSLADLVEPTEKDA